MNIVLRKLNNAKEKISRTKEVANKEQINIKKDNDFFLYLIKEMEEHKYIYTEDECLDKNIRDYLNNLFYEMNEYSNANKLTTNIGMSKSMFCESDMLLKNKDKFYLLELIIGQGSYIGMRKLKNNEIKETYEYIDYDYMIKNKKPTYLNKSKEVNKKNILKEK